MGPSDNHPVALQACCPPGELPSRRVALQACCPPGVLPSRRVALQTPPFHPVALQAGCPPDRLPSRKKNSSCPSDPCFIAGRRLEFTIRPTFSSAELPPRHLPSLKPESFHSGLNFQSRILEFNVALKYLSPVHICHLAH